MTLNQRSRPSYPSKLRPDCGHKLLQECPLTVADWEIVFFAMLGFRETCRLVSDKAHERAAKAAPSIPATEATR